MKNEVINQDQAIAMEILKQLGGNKFLAMTGSKNLSFDKGGVLQMKLTRNQAKAQYLRVELTPMDTYTMYFFAFDKNYNKTVDVVKEGVYCDTIQDVFTSVTGLYTKL